MSAKKDEFVIIETGGKQYILEVGSVISVEKLPEGKDKKVLLKNVLLHSKKEKLDIGTPYLDVAVEAEILANEKDKKVRVFKFKPKTGFKKKQGHRQTYTTLRVLSIGSSKAAKITAATEEKSTKTKSESQKKAASSTSSKKTTEKAKAKG